jgi:hypothetical protein
MEICKKILSVTVLMFAPIAAHSADDEAFFKLAIGLTTHAAEALMGKADAEVCSTTLGIRKCIWTWSPLFGRRQYTATFVFDRVIQTTCVCDRDRAKKAIPSTQSKTHQPTGGNYENQL